MRSRRTWCAGLLAAGALAGVAAGAVRAQEPEVRREVRTVTIRVPNFEADTSQVPELQPWGRAAEALCQAWYGRIVAALDSDETKRPAPETVKIVFEKEMDGVAYANRNEIHIAAHWVRRNPNDFGMVAHELTHIVQRYPRNRNAGWLVEGVADYVRLQHFEPALARPKIDFTRAKHTDAYKTTAQFLIYLEEKYGSKVVPSLHAALQEGRYSDQLFQELTGKEVGTLWQEFAEASAA
ncbi:MAG: basic secretory protein-like protein [Armatimonadota bacterium]